MDSRRGETVPTHRPKVSVVIPTYREEKYIGGLLSTLAEVNYPLEVIVVDGESPDETVKVAECFTDKVYRIHERGIAKARNYGAYRSTGDILVFLDADVIPSLDFVERILDVFHDRNIVGATCNVVPEHPRMSELIFFNLYNRLIQFSSRFLPHSRGEFIAVRREDFVETGGFDESLACLEDHDLAFRLSKLGRFVVVPDLYVHESMRRVRKSGLDAVLMMWITNYVSFILLGRTISKTWRPVR